MPTRRCLGCRRQITVGSRCAACTAASPYRSREWRQTVRANIGASCAVCDGTHRLVLHHLDGRHPSGDITIGPFATLCTSCHTRYEADRRARRSTALTAIVDGLPRTTSRGSSA